MAVEFSSEQRISFTRGSILNIVGDNLMLKESVQWLWSLCRPPDTTIEEFLEAFRLCAEDGHIRKVLIPFHPGELWCSDEIYRLISQGDAK